MFTVRNHAECSLRNREECRGRGVKKAALSAWPKPSLLPHRIPELLEKTPGLPTQMANTAVPVPTPEATSIHAPAAGRHVLPPMHVIWDRVTHHTISHSFG